MKTLSIAISLVLLSITVALGMSQGPMFLTSPLLMQSFESKTITEGPVFNEITWFEFPEKDVWMMNQSHFGINPPSEKKDRVVIVIDKTKAPKKAYFMQLKPGPLLWSEDLYAQKTAYRVSCFICHSNGLRTIRMDPSIGVIGAWDWAKLNYMNHKINSYGLVVEDERHESEDLRVDLPFRSRVAFDNEILSLKKCAVCHDGKLRGALTRQNSFSIDFLVRNNLMPPAGSTLNQMEAKRLKNFIRGF